MMKTLELTPAIDPYTDEGQNDLQVQEQPELPLVSVAIACYNQAHFLPAALESVRAQTYANVEIIVVDDGSEDQTAEVAAAYAGVQLIRQANRGLSAARNTGLRHSQGDYVVFLDADDRLLPRALEVGVLCLEGQPACAFASGHYRYIHEDGTLLNEFSQNRVQDQHYLALLRGNYIGMHASVIYRRSVFAEVGGFDTSLRACEDYDLYLRIARRFPVYCHDEVIAEYRQHRTNMSGDPSLMLEQALGVLRRQWPHIKSDPACKRAYRYGLLSWQAYYGEKFFARAAQKRAQGKPRQAARMLLPVLWRTPLYAAYHTARWLYGRGYATLYRLFTPTAREQIAQRLYKLAAPRVGAVRFGELRRLEPIAQGEALSPALQVDHHYIESFIAGQAHYLQGHLLQVGSMAYPSAIQGERITAFEYLPLGEGQDANTFVDDLSCAHQLGANQYDCILLIQALHRVYDLHAALQTLHRLLKPGGVLLATLPGIGFVKRTPTEEAGYWAFTDYSARQLFETVFPRQLVGVEAKGNVLATVARLQGLSLDALQPEELAYVDPQYQLLITVRAIKE